MQGEKNPVPFGLNLKYKLACALVFKKLQMAPGGRIRWICAAGVPIAREIVNFFNAAGIFILEGWGMSDDFSHDTGELTTTLKMRRKVVMEKFQGMIDTMYKNE